MNKYEVRRNSIEIPWKKRREIKEGITTMSDFQAPEIIESFDNLEEAQAALQKYSSSIAEMSGATGTYYSVTEYYIEENTYDEDGEWLEGGDVWEVSKLSFSLIEKPSYNTLATFDNMEDAVKAYDNYNGENEVYLSY